MRTVRGLFPNSPEMKGSGRHDGRAPEEEHNNHVYVYRPGT
jgi:hypothetical protein